MKNLVISASRIEIDTESERTFLVDMEMSDSEYESILSQFYNDDIVRICGVYNLLNCMDVDEIISYLNDIGFKMIREGEE